MPTNERNGPDDYRDLRPDEAEDRLMVNGSFQTVVEELRSDLYRSYGSDEPLPSPPGWYRSTDFGYQYVPMPQPTTAELAEEARRRAERDALRRERDERIEAQRRMAAQEEVRLTNPLSELGEVSSGQLPVYYTRYVGGENNVATVTGGQTKVTGASAVAQGQGAPAKAFPNPVFEGQMGPSIVPDDLRHIIIATGSYGSGKTTFVCGIENPQNVLMLDYEGKGESVASQLGIKNYFAPTLEASDLYGFEYKALHAFLRTKQILQAMPSGRFTVLILDGLMTLQQGMLEEVKRNPVAYGVKAENAASGAMGGAYPGVGVLLEMVFATARTKGVKVIGVTTEIGSVWGDRGPLLNKFEMKGQKVINKMSVLTVMLTKPSGPGAPPSGVVLKEQLAKTEFKDGKLVVTKRIPPRLPEATMAAVYGYMQSPPDFGRLRPEEIPSEEELAPFEKTISKQQLADMRMWLEAMRVSAAAAAEEVEETETVVAEGAGGTFRPASGTATAF